ncbi:hypothetical protein [Natronorubrum aibiense]|uniref:DUF8098 domain-containing protein n=1 Tax=Natronorubrum aibiense TaxID=348826 RepID=A0A5P9P5H3_9EURY|nr:hypothetical protein [Natronorubrum aibiense]QFU83378.1 hypothetical protein GCU68_12930 [Natronorubrum aibiense]
MTSLSVEEDQALARDAVRGLEAAMDEESLTTGELFTDPEPYGRVRLNKLIHMALAWGYDESDRIPIQHSWHRYGADYGNAIPQVSELQPTEFCNLPSPDQPSISSQHGNRYPSKEEYYHFFINKVDLNRIAGLSIHAFLKEFYEEYAPPKYRSLYLANVDLQRILHNHSKSINVDQFGEEEYQDITRTVTHLHTELVSCSDEEIPQIASRVVEFTDLLEDTYMMLASRSAEDVPSSPELVIREISRVYHDTAWKYVSEIISKSTAQGTNSSELVTAASGEIEKLDSRHRGVPEQLMSLIADADLLPSPEDFDITSDPDSESGEQFVDLSEEYASLS